MEDRYDLIRFDFEMFKNDHINKNFTDYEFLYEAVDNSRWDIIEYIIDNSDIKSQLDADDCINWFEWLVFKCQFKLYEKMFTNIDYCVEGLIFFEHFVDHIEELESSTILKILKWLKEKECFDLLKGETIDTIEENIDKENLQLVIKFIVNNVYIKDQRLMRLMEI